MWSNMKDTGQNTEIYNTIFLNSVVSSLFIFVDNIEFDPLRSC
jgi:hypothetical protein